MSDLPTVQVPANQTLETNVKVPHKHRGGTYLRKHLGVGAHKGDRNAQRLLKSRKYYSLSRDEFHCIADLDFTFPVHLHFFSTLPALFSIALRCYRFRRRVRRNNTLLFLRILGNDSRFAASNFRHRLGSSIKYGSCPTFS